MSADVIVLSSILLDVTASVARSLLSIVPLTISSPVFTSHEAVPAPAQLTEPAIA